MATHTSILVWRISWTEEPGGSIRVTESQTGQIQLSMHRLEPPKNSTQYLSPQVNTMFRVPWVLALCQGLGGVTRKMDDLHPLVDGQMKKGGKCLSVACIQRWKNYTQVGEVEGGFPAGSGITPSYNLAPCGSSQAWLRLGVPGVLWGSLKGALFPADSEGRAAESWVCGTVVLGSSL